MAGGKGVIVAMTLEEAINGIKDIFSGVFGKAGTEVVIEEFMEGKKQVSLFYQMAKTFFQLEQHKITNASIMVIKGQILVEWEHIPQPL